LERELFFALTEAQILIEQWRTHYNRVRPHSALDKRSPGPETRVSPASVSLPPLALGVGGN